MKHEERDSKAAHAYLIMAHGRPEQLCALLKQIDDPRNDIFLHYDKKFIPPVEMLHQCVQYSNLHILQNPISVNWGDSQIQCELLLMEAATEHKAYDYYHLLSGQDLLLQSQDYIHDFFEQHAGKEFISMGSAEWAEKLKYRHKYYFPCLNRVKNLRSKKKKAMLVVWMLLQKVVGIDRTRNIQEEMRTGAIWFSITDRCVRYVLSKKTWIETVFRDTFCCDEFFLQTVVHNAEESFELYSNPDGSADMRYIDWKRGSPYTFRTSDFEELKKSSAIFARKFDQYIDAHIIELITGWEIK